MFYIFKKAFKYYKSAYPAMIFHTLLGFCNSTMMLLEPQILSLMVDSIVVPALGGEVVQNTSVLSFLVEGVDGSWQKLWRLAAAFAIFVVFFFVTFYTEWNISHWATTKCDNKLRFDVLAKINSYGPRLMKDYSSGDIVTIMTSDAKKVETAQAEGFHFLMDNSFYMILSGVFLARVNIWLAFVPVIFAATFFLISRGFMKLCDEMYDKLWHKDSALNTETQESIYGIRTIKALGREKMRRERFATKARDIRDNQNIFAAKRFKYFFLFDLDEQVGMVISMAFCIFLCTRFKMTAGEYTSFIIYMLSIAGCLIDFIFISGDIRDAKVSAKRVFGLLEKEDTVLAAYGDKKVSDAPHIVLDHISIHADKENTADLLHDVSLDITPGKRIGLMGKTGCGKSLLLKALQAFEEIDEGSISIDGLDIHQYDRGEVTRTFGYAMQDVFLFSNTISSNIAFYDPTASEEKVRLCGKIAEVDEFAKNMPEGYETLIGEKGFGLSGGQKQRVAIARALLKDAPITLLDDCTSALDVDTEAKVFNNLFEHFKDKTLLMATHRAAALRDFDEILFMEDGKVVERGTFDELMACGGKFAEIYNIQQDLEVC